MKTKELRFKMEVIVFCRYRKKPLCGKVIYCSVSDFFLVYEFLTEFARRKQVSKVFGNTIQTVGYAINTFIVNKRD
jgi:hypothetical protein